MSREFALPHSHAHWTRDRVVDIEHVRLVLDVDPTARRVAGRAELTLRVIAPGTRHVELDAVELAISAVTVDGTAREFVADGRHLRVDLGRATPAGERLALAVTYAGSPRRGLYFIAPDEGYPKKGVQVWSQGQDEDSRYWFPCFDAPHEKATSEVEVTIPAHLTAWSNGVLISDRSAGARRTQHFRLDVPHSAYLITLAVGDFAVLQARAGELGLTYLVERGREADCQRTLERTPAMIAFFERRLGVPYPYPHYAQVFVSDFIFGGMENTSATTLTDSVLLDERAAVDHDADSLVAHELAHQWFGDLVTCRDWGEGWLNEGFATYCEYLWFEHHRGRDDADHELDGWLELYLGEDRGRYRRHIATKVYDEPIDIFDHHLYEKGGRVLHLLRTELGDDAFFAAIQHYLTKHRFGVVETRDLARAVEESSGRGLDWFFDQWVTGGAGHPELTVTCAWDAGLGRLVVGVKQTQTIDARTPCFRLPLIVRVRDAGGAERDVRFEVREAQHSFQLELATAPAQVVIDPGRVLLAELTVDKPQPLWLAELADATLAADRVAAARALGRLGGPSADAALRVALERDPHWTVRAAAAKALASQRSVAGKPALLAAATTDAHPKARRAITAALGDYLGDDEVAAALVRVLERGDASYFVEAAAAHALGRTRSPRAAAALRQAARRDSFQDVIRAGAYRGLAEARDESAATLLQDGTRWGEQPQGRRAAIMALAQLMRGRRDLAARDAREAIEALLRDRDFRVQAAAIEGLAMIGDPTSIEALRLLIARELDGRLRRRAREVVRDLAEGAPLAEELRRLRDELDAVRALATGLRERLERLEPATSPLAAGAPDTKRGKKAQRRDSGGGKRAKKKAKR